MAQKLSNLFLKIFAWLLIFIAVAVGFFAAMEAVADSHFARKLPSYEKQDITAVLEKEEWSEKDYDFLYHQTGVGKSALDSMKGDNERILSFQEALFYDGEITHTWSAFTTPHEKVKDYTAPIIPLENGDVLVTSSTHTLGWTHGHAAIVVENFTQSILEAYALGYDSSIGSTTWFRQSTNFIVLRLKDKTRAERMAIASEAVLRLNGVPYSLTVGLFSPKDQGEQPKETNCSHLVWQAFKYAGYDIDPDGGPICTPRDIANCNLFEVVQVYGFDVDKLW